MISSQTICPLETDHLPAVHHSNGRSTDPGIDATIRSGDVGDDHDVRKGPCKEDERAKEAEDEQMSGAEESVGSGDDEHNEDGRDDEGNEYDKDEFWDDSERDADTDDDDDDNSETEVGDSRGAEDEDDERPSPEATADDDGEDDDEEDYSLDAAEGVFPDEEDGLPGIRRVWYALNRLNRYRNPPAEIEKPRMIFVNKKRDFEPKSVSKNKWWCDSVEGRAWLQANWATFREHRNDALTLIGECDYAVSRAKEPRRR